MTSVNEPFSLFRKLASRKLAIAILAIVASVEGHSLSTTHMVTLGVVAVAYIVAEAFVDRAARESVTADLAKGLADGVALGRRSLGESDDDDSGDPPTPGGSAPPTRPDAAPAPSAPGGRSEKLGLVFACMVLAAVLAIACAPARHAPNPACSKERLAAIEAAFVAEAVTTCRGYTVTTCAELPKVEAKYQAQREEWVQCR